MPFLDTFIMNCAARFIHSSGNLVAFYSVSCGGFFLVAKIAGRVVCNDEGWQRNQSDRPVYHWRHCTSNPSDRANLPVVFGGVVVFSSDVGVL